MNHEQAPPSIRRSVLTFAHRGRNVGLLKKQMEMSAFAPYFIREYHEASDFSALFLREAPVVLEIGFGHADVLVALAKTYPHINYIGVEVYQAGVLAGMRHLHEYGLKNVRIYHGDALDIMEQGIKDASLQGINIFFPDPWPKRRHHKRRLIQAEVVDLLGSKLASEGFLHLATDVEAYALLAQRVLQASAYFLRIDHTPSVLYGYRGGQDTKFEKRGKRLGHQVWDMYFIKR